MKIIIKRIKRVISHWLDSEFDGDEYADRVFFSVGDSDYYIVENKTVNGKNYLLYNNIDDKTDIFFRRFSIVDGHERLSCLEDEEEFDAVWTAFFGIVPNETPEGDFDAFNSIKAAVREGEADE